jgi:hypothetical protein
MFADGSFGVDWEQTGEKGAQKIQNGADIKSR